MCTDRKENFLASVLLEALEDENPIVVERFLCDYKCNPNRIISGRGIAPIHYACGMENLELAEKITEMMLEHGGDPNVKSADQMTPLHVASAAGRTKIVRLLLEHGGDIHTTDEENKTPVTYALHAYEIEVIKTMQDFMYEKKLDEKKRNYLMSANRLQDQSPRNKNLLSAQTMEPQYTPNRVHYNFDRTSPYYIYITHRKSNTKVTPVPLHEMPPPEVEAQRTSENLFQLTEENLCKFAGELSSTEKSQESMIQIWRDKVLRSRQHKSILKTFNDIDGLLEGICSDDTLNFSNTCIDSTHNSNAASTKLDNAEMSFGKFLEQLRCAEVRDDSSFLTANDRFLDEPRSRDTLLSESKFIRSPNGGEFVMQVEEVYTHTDDENGLVFYETKLYTNPVDKWDMNTTTTSRSSNVSMPSTCETEELRAELTQFGEPPGPITKSTKRLYQKRLIKYRRNAEAMMNRRDEECRPHEPQFSVELERTVVHKEWFHRINEHLYLEKELSEHFHQNGQRRKFREGNFKTSFIYLLIDPRKSGNLSGDHKYMTEHDIWKRFLDSIFYVGKGKSSRPYSHLYDAMKVFSHNDEFISTQSDEVVNRKLHFAPTTLESRKLQNIIDIWRSERGVVCLHVFHNIMPAEAYTREAAIIDAMGLKHLTNIKRGDYYGPCQSWMMRMKKFLGIVLLSKALKIYLAEGESQLRPSDLA